MPDKTARRRAFGLHLQELRRERGWSQIGLAHHIGMDPTYLSGVENGHRNVSLDALYRIADGLEADIQDLFPRERN